MLPSLCTIYAFSIKIYYNNNNKFLVIHVSFLITYQGKDLPVEMLTGLYRRIKEEEIKMDEGDMYESEVVTFMGATRWISLSRRHHIYIYRKKKGVQRINYVFSLSRKGWLRKQGTSLLDGWAKRWFVLTDSCLYYFKHPQVCISLVSILFFLSRLIIYF